MPQRKCRRLKEYDYSSSGAYFITVCTQGMKHILSTIRVGGGIHDAPEVVLSDIGKIVDGQIKIMNSLYENIKVEHYVIMPNHIHMIIEIDDKPGTSGRPSPTRSNEYIPRYISTLKRFVNKKCGRSIFQRSYYDHIIRNEKDYLEKRRYIEENAVKWEEDKYYKW